MNNPTQPRTIIAAKCAALTGFLTLVTCTYYLRGEALALSHIKFSADEVRAANELAQLRESFPDRQKQYEADLKQFELETEHYRKMLELYQDDYDEYVKRVEDRYDPPPLPHMPDKPDPPEVGEQLHEINTAFRTRKNDYFETSSHLNWVACAAALLLSGGLLYLLLFDTTGQRWHYLAALVLSFAFLIGPAFHSVITAIIGFLQEPGVH